MKYIIEIKPKYWEERFPDWDLLSNEEKQKSINTEMDRMNEILRTDNMKSIFTMKKHLKIHVLGNNDTVIFAGKIEIV